MTRVSAEAHLSFLAADEMRGRDTGSPEIAIAANYIEAYYKMVGLKKPAGSNSYFQEVGLQKTLPPKKVELTLGSDVFKFKTDLLLRTEHSFSSSADFVFVGYGLADDFHKTDVKGKVVVAYSGHPRVDARPASLSNRFENEISISKGERRVGVDRDRCF